MDACGRPPTSKPGVTYTRDMAEVRPFRGLRYDAARVDPAVAIAPPYDVISAAQQAALYERSPYNIVRIEYGEQRATDSASNNRYTRAARDLGAWQREGVLGREREGAIYAYRVEFEWEGEQFARHHYFAAVRLEEWDKGIIKPHEHTLSGPKADRLDLLRATRTQVSPVYCLYRPRQGGGSARPIKGSALYDVAVDGQRHVLSAITDAAEIGEIAARMRDCDVYIADGHHRYETALRYRDECRAQSSTWSGDEPENFVLMALSDAGDPGLLVLPTHRMVNPPSVPDDRMGLLAELFDVHDITAACDPQLEPALGLLASAGANSAAFIVAGLEPGRVHLLTLRDRSAGEALMPQGQPEAWKQLDVSVLQFAILRHVFGIDDAALAAGTAVTYSQDASAALAAVHEGRAHIAFLLNATPVGQVLAVADASGRMPQKSTFFYPKLPTGLVMNSLA